MGRGGKKKYRSQVIYTFMSLVQKTYVKKKIIGIIFQFVGTAGPVVPYICQLVKKHHTSVREVSLPEWESASVSA